MSNFEPKYEILLLFLYNDLVLKNVSKCDFLCKTKNQSNEPKIFYNLILGWVWNYSLVWHLQRNKEQKIFYWKGKIQLWKIKWALSPWKTFIIFASQELVKRVPYKNPYKALEGKSLNYQVVQFRHQGLGIFWGHTSVIESVRGGRGCLKLSNICYDIIYWGLLSRAFSRFLETDCLNPQSLIFNCIIYCWK